MSMNWKIAQSIYNKIISNCPQGTYQQQLTKTPITNYPLSSRYGCFFCDGNSAHDYNVSTNYKTACAGKPSGHTRFLNFSSETERYNAWQSYLTKFARFCVMLDESTKLAPYMDDYTEPWTDERFKQYFGLTDIEWQLIDTVIKD